MDTDEVMLDWGAHDDEDGTPVHSQALSGKVRQENLATKDEATMSGAESLLALASGGLDVQDDKDSDVVSLGGGEDDMEELYAYQSRTHLGGGVASGDNPNVDKPVVHQSKHADAANSEEGGSAKAPAASSTSPAAIPKNSKNSLSSNHPVTDSSKSQSKSIAQPQPQSKALAGEPTRPSSTTKLTPPTGPLGLPPKPVAVPPTPYIRPSHPSIMSASSMAAPARERDRDLQRDHHDNMKGKHGPHRHTSPENDGLPLAPGWETRRSRDGTQDMYYYNTKTQQSTWSRSIATGMSSTKPEGSASPVYARNRAKEHFKPPGQDPPVSRDVARLASHDAESQPRPRSTRFDPVSTEPSVSSGGGPGLSFEERYYRPGDSRPVERTPPYSNGDFRAQPQARGPSGPHLMHRDNPPASVSTHPTLRHGSDRVRDFQAVNRVHSRDRDERELTPFGDRAAPSGRNGERRVERSRSRSPGRGRSRIMWPNELNSNAWVRDDDAVPPSNEQRRAPTAVLEGSRPTYGGSTPPLLYRGAPQVARSSSLGRDDRSSRYAPPPNHDQSSSRDRHRSPPPPERLRKRTRSNSPDFNVNPRAFRPLPQSHSSRHNSRWGEFDPNQSRQRDQTTHFDDQSRDRPPLHFPEPSTLLTSVAYTDRVRSRSNERDRSGGSKDFDRENDAKRRKVFDNPDSVGSRRPHSDSHGDRDTRFGDPPRRKRQPLPPQSERFKEVAAAPPAPPPGHISNNSLPLATPSGPRRLSTRETNYPDIVQQQPGRGRPPIQRNNFEDTRGQMGSNSQAKHFEISDKFVEGHPYEERGRPRQWDRERERDKTFPAELPTGPRAMDHDAEPPRFIRRDRSPPRQRTERSPPSHFATNGPHESDRRDHLGSGGFRHSFGGADRAYREQDRQSGSRVGESQEFGHPRLSGPDSLSSYKPHHHHQQQHRLMFNSKTSGTNIVPVVPTRKFGVGQATPEEAPPSSHSSFINRPESRRSPIDDERWEPRLTKGPAAFSQDPILSTSSGNVDEQRRASFSRAPSSNMRFENHPVPGLRASPPSDETNPLPGNSRRQRFRMQSSYPSASQPPLDRQSLPEEEDIPAIWDRRGSNSYQLPTEARGATSEHPKEHPVNSLPRSQPISISSLHSRDNNGEHESQQRRSSHAAETSTDTNRGGPKQEGSLTTGEDNMAQHSKTKSDVEAQPSDPAGLTGVDSERSRPVLYPRPASPPPGARTFRIRRPSKLPEPTEFRDPVGRGNLQTSRAPLRQSSLLDRISNPSSSAPGATPPLRDRVSSPGNNWKRGGPAPQAGPGTSLRDRLEGVGDARHSMNIEWDQSYEDAGNGSNRRDKQNRRDRPRRGRGQ